MCAEALGANNVSDPGSCCKREDDIALGWCTFEGSATDTRFASACDPTSPQFGTVNWALGTDGQLQEADPNAWRQSEEESGFCEVLGHVRPTRLSLQ